MFWLVALVGRALDGSFVSGFVLVVFGSGPDPGSDRPRRSELGGVFFFSSLSGFFPFFGSAALQPLAYHERESHASRCYGTYMVARFVQPPPLLSRN